MLMRMLIIVATSLGANSQSHSKTSWRAPTAAVDGRAGERSNRRSLQIASTGYDACWDFDTPFATRCPKKAKSCRNAHKTGAAGATAQLGLPGPLRGCNPFQNRVVSALVCTFSPANTLATPIPLRLTADAIMQDLHQTGCSRPAWSWGAAGLLPTPSL